KKIILFTTKMKNSTKLRSLPCLLAILAGGALQLFYAADKYFAYNSVTRIKIQRPVVFTVPRVAICSTLFQYASDSFNSTALARKFVISGQSPQESILEKFYFYFKSNIK